MQSLGPLMLHLVHLFRKVPLQSPNYRCISLCNLIYYIIAKVIANWIRPRLVACMSNWIIGWFLMPHHKGSTRVPILNLGWEIGGYDSKNGSSKSLWQSWLDLSKANPSPNWFKYWGDRLNHGLRYLDKLCSALQWFTHRLFKSYKGLRQGYPLSPLLVLLVVEGLSMDNPPG